MRIKINVKYVKEIIYYNMIKKVVIILISKVFKIVYKLKKH